MSGEKRKLNNSNADNADCELTDTQNTTKIKQKRKQSKKTFGPKCSDRNYYK